MAINDELRKAVEKAVRDSNQPASLSQRITAWLTDMGKRDLTKQEQSRHLINVRSAIDLPDMGSPDEN